MSLLVLTKSLGEYTHEEGSHLTTRPGTTNWGTQTVPGNNTFGTPVQIGANLTEDLWAIRFQITGVAASAQGKDCLVQIGFDFAGGTTFPASPDRYNSITLLASCAGPYNQGGGVEYFFPLFVPAGTAILARSSVNNATVGSAYVAWHGYGRPKNPESCRAGSFVESLGIVSATSRGTTVTPGTTSDGTAVLLGTLDSDHSCWYWEYGYGCNDTTMSNAALHADLQAGSGGPFVLQNGLVNTTTSETVNKRASARVVPIFDVAGGTEIYGRLQSSGTADSNVSMAAYGVGG